MKISILLSLIALSTALSACSGSGGSSGSGGVKKITVNGKTPEAYFNQFQFSYKGSCDKKEDMLFKYLESESFLVRTEGVFKIIGQIDLYLMSENKFFIKYREVKAENYQDLENYSGPVEKEEQAYLSYAIKDGVLILDKLAKGEALTRNDEDVILITINKESAEMGGKQLVLNYVERSTTSLPGMKNGAETCASMR